MVFAEKVIEVLRLHEAELRSRGIRHLSIFGSVARNQAGPESDVDLLADLDPEARISLIGLSALEQHITELVGRRVDITTEPIERPSLRANINRDRRIAF